jgi:flagellar hook-basal body complex protein FliE
MRIESINPNNFLNETVSQKNKDNKGFEDILKNFIIDVNSDLQNAKLAEHKIETGEVQNMNYLIYQIEKSEISLRLITEIRNKALESYQEIMRMQV